MVLALISAQTVQALSFLHLDHMKLQTNLATFQFHDLLKQKKPGNLSPTLLIRGYPPDRWLCSVKYLCRYIEETSTIWRTERYLLISCKKPLRGWLPRLSPDDLKMLWKPQVSIQMCTSLFNKGSHYVSCKHHRCLDTGHYGTGWLVKWKNI